MRLEMLADWLAFEDREVAEANVGYRLLRLGSVQRAIPQAVVLDSLLHLRPARMKVALSATGMVRMVASSA